VCWEKINKIVHYHLQNQNGESEWSGNELSRIPETYLRPTVDGLGHVSRKTPKGSRRTRKRVSGSENLLLRKEKSWGGNVARGEFDIRKKFSKEKRKKDRKDNKQEEEKTKLMLMNLFSESGF